MDGREGKLVMVPDLLVFQRLLLSWKERKERGEWKDGRKGRMERGEGKERKERKDGWKDGIYRFKT